MASRLFTISRRYLASPADAAAFLRQKRVSDKFATTTAVAEHLRNVTKAVDVKAQDPKLQSMYSQSNGTGRFSVDNTAGKPRKLVSMYTKDAHLD